MSPVDELIDEFVRIGWKGTPMERTVRLIADAPWEVTSLVRGIIERAPAGGTFLDLALSFLPEGDWPGIVSLALIALDRDTGNESAASIVEYASLQALPSLHPHLPEIFRLAPNADTYYAVWPWRESGLTQLPALGQVVWDTARPDEHRQRAWMAITETRTSEAIALASDLYAGMKFGAKLDGLLQEADYARRNDGTLMQIDPPRVMHLCFPKDYFHDDPRRPWVSIHPTWHFISDGSAPVVGTARFGGQGAGMCNHCGKPLHHLLTLDPVPTELFVKSLGRLSICTCLSCLGWEADVRVGFYGHDARGEPHDITESRSGTPQFPSGALQETTVQLVETPPRWRWQDWALSNARENLHRIGGHPCWIQGADELPRCPRCQELMTFLFQLDSNLPCTTMREWLWGSGGIAYVCWCDACQISGVFWQCT